MAETLNVTSMSLERPCSPAVLLRLASLAELNVQTEAGLLFHTLRAWSFSLAIALFVFSGSLFPETPRAAHGKHRAVTRGLR